MEQGKTPGSGWELLEKRHEQHYQQLKCRVLERLDCSEEIGDDKVYEWIDQEVLQYGQEIYISLEEKLRLRQEIFNSLRKLDILQELVDCPGVTEIMINGMDNIFIEEEGKIRKWEKCFESVEKLEDVVQQIVGRTNRMVNESNPIVDTRLENGSRVNIVLPPVALNGPVVTIRRFPDKAIQMDDLISYRSIDKETARFLKRLVQAGYNIFISGGTGSGKTTFLNVLSNYIPKDERIITIEDSAELQIRNIPNLVRLETRNANSEGKNEITIRELIKSALRMRPDRIVVGEVRGGEAVDMLQCLNTGHLVRASYQQ
ncbi:MAG: CpaF family protein [Lachnospiraceae bacterium]|nr:CpaF family protein [Lachnospiraceae bacterium]